MQVGVSRWGNSLGIRVPKELAAKLALREGTRVEMVVEGSRLVLTRVDPPPSLAALLVGMTPAALHEAFDWGDDVGRERIE
jgi:antitoxin MazE